MFSLIITIISIALVAALAVASVYYGGSAFSQGTAKAAASTLVAQAQQITGAQVLYANDNAGALAAAIGDLEGDYLSSIPAANADVVGATGAWTLSGRLVTIPVVNSEVALKVLEQAGVDSPEVADITEVADPTAANALNGLPQFGVVDTNTAATAGGLVFFYKG